MVSTNNPIVDEIGRYDFPAYLVAPRWYTAIVRENGKPHFPAIAILADILAWYSPELIYNQQGYVVGARARFEGKYLSRNYVEYGEMLNMTKTEVVRAVKHLEDIGVIKRHFYSFKDEASGQKTVNNLMIELKPETLYEIT